MKIIREKTPARSYVLGLDLGSTSIGWACVETRNGRPADVMATGVRLFDAGMSGDFQKAAEMSNAITRREKRLARRQIHRKAVRRWSVFKLLRDHNLLPHFGIQSLRELSPHVQQMDRELAERYGIKSDHISSQLLVYRIRAKAAKEAIPLHDLGRALMHLAKRRGFNSNLRGIPKKDEDEGLIKSSIKSLATELDSRSVTLGEYFSQSNPIQQRIRKRWTGREMFIREFDAIWATQSKYHPVLSEELYKKLRKAIFFQRPLRSAKGLVGKCSIITSKTRLMAAHPLPQEVRMLQFVNNVRITESGKTERQLSQAERDKAVSVLSNCGKLTIKQFRDLLGLPKKSKLNFDNDDDTHAYGMGTSSALRSILGKQWESLDEPKKELLIYDLSSFNKRDALLRHLDRKWGITGAEAEELSELTLEAGYSNHCREALQAIRHYLLNQDPESMRWLTYPEAKQKAFPQSRTMQTFERLPPVRNALRGITNPAVIRALTELRKVVNELIDRFGQPGSVRIELARELKKTKKERKKIEDLVREQAKNRSKAISRIRNDFTGYAEKSGYDRGIEMVLLAEECNWQCPYTGEAISSVKDLIGDNSRFDIEHIFPRRYLDNSFSNKTLCLHHENRNIKKDRLPAIAYQGSPDRFEEILARVRRFRGPAANKKLQRFMATEVPNDFVNRQLDETRYISRTAAEYVGLIFGGRIDENGRQRVFTVSGGLTAILRGQWKLNQILGMTAEKNRADHRHHAIDAIVIACTDSNAIQSLQNAAAIGWQHGDLKRIPSIDPPFSEILEASRRSVLSIIVSHRPNRKLNGPLHAETLYSVRRNLQGKYDTKSRRPLEKITAAQIDLIVDTRVKEIVKKKYEELLTKHKAPRMAGDLFTIENHPFIENSDGSRTPIHSVRIWEKAGDTDPKHRKITVNGVDRFVASTGGSNYCVRFYSILDRDGRVTGWKDRILSRFEAMKLFSRNNKKNVSDVVPKPEIHIDSTSSVKASGVDQFDESRFLFDLFINDFLVMKNKQGSPTLYRVLSLSAGDIEVRAHVDARKSEEVKKSKERVRIGPRAISKMEFRKVDVSPSGVVRDSITGEFFSFIN